jgi:small subunit ribosomal protein S4e
MVLLRNRLKYALTGKEVMMIVRQRSIKVDNRIRTDPTFPAGFMDVVQIPRTNEHFRLLFDVKGRFAIQRIRPEEAAYKLCKVRERGVGPRRVPYITTHDGRTIRYPDPLIKKHDSIKLNLRTGKITDFIKFETGNLAMVTGGRNLGRVGVITSKEKHPGSFEILHLKDAAGNEFSTRLMNVFVIGKGTKSLVSLPRRKGIKKTILEEREWKENQKKELEKKS